MHAAAQEVFLTPLSRTTELQHRHLKHSTHWTHRTSPEPCTWIMERQQKDGIARGLNGENVKSLSSGLTPSAYPAVLGSSSSAAPAPSLASFASSPAFLPTQFESVGSKRSRTDLELPDEGLRRNRSKTGLGLPSRYASTGLLVRRGGGSTTTGGGQHGGANAEWESSTLGQEELMYNKMQGGAAMLNPRTFAMGGSGLIGGAGGLGQAGGMTMMPMTMKNSSGFGAPFMRSQSGPIGGSGLRPAASKIERPSAKDFVSMMGLERPQQKNKQAPPQLSNLTPSLGAPQSQILSKNKTPSLSTPAMEMSRVRRRLSQKRSSLVSVEEDMWESIGGSSLSINQSETSEPSAENPASVKNEEDLQDVKYDLDVCSIESFGDEQKFEGEDAPHEDFDFDNFIDDNINVSNNIESEINPALIPSSNGCDNDVNGKDGISFEEYNFDDSDDNANKEEISNYEGMDLEPTPLSTEQERILKEKRHTQQSNGSIDILEDNDRGSSDDKCGPKKPLLPLAPAATIGPKKKSTNGSATSSTTATNKFLQEVAYKAVAGGRETPDTTSADGSAERERAGKEGGTSEKSFISSLNRMIKDKGFKQTTRRSSDLISDDEILNDQYLGSQGHPTGIVAMGTGLPSNQSGSSTDWISDAILALNNGNPTRPDADGMLPIHLACIYCPNNKRLVGTILIDNPDTARLCIEPNSDEGSSDGTKSEMNASKNENQSSVSANSNIQVSSRKKVISVSAVNMLQGSFPLHVALRSMAGEKVTYEVVKLLSLAAPDVLTAADKSGAVPLSVALQHRVGSQIVRYLLQQSRASAKIVDQKNNFPLHFACTNVSGKKAYSMGIIKLISDAYPYAINRKNDDGKTPLDLAKELPSAETIITFLQNKISRTTEEYT